MKFHFMKLDGNYKKLRYNKVIISLYSGCLDPVKLSNAKLTICTIFYINIYADAIYIYFNE